MAFDFVEVEIADIPPLKHDEAALLDHHSVLNVMNVVCGELTLLGLLLEDDPGLLAGGLAVCDECVGALRDSPRAREFLAAHEERSARILAAADAELDRHPGRREDPAVAECRRNLETVLGILRTRARELLARMEEPMRWKPFPIHTLRQSFLEVFAAIEAHSHGRFRIRYNFALQEPRDYYVDLKFEVVQGDTVWMPPVFVDVMRDLIANARKYTAPGGQIIASLHEGPAELRFAVQDTGRGIPEAELARVVHFGSRGSNVDDVRTLGGGFGLTKAFCATRRFGGRFWLASRLGVGTRIRIVVPRPHDLPG